jgi:hypothetical protein
MSPATAGNPSRHARVPAEVGEPWLALLAGKAPDEFRALVRARRRLEWADLIAQTIGHLSGLVALSILAAISWHAIDRGAATQGASIICTGAVSIVAVFVTGRLTSGSSHPRRGRDRELPEPDRTRRD